MSWRSPRGLAVAVAVVAVVVAAAAAVIEWDLPGWVVGIYLGTSILTFLVYAADKSAASTGRRRTPERALLALGLVGGWPGAAVAQRMLRHKTRKMRFQLAFWGTAALNVAALVAVNSPGFAELLARLSRP